MNNIKSKNITIILAVFLWWIWAHKFYLWKNILWILYALFCWTFIPSIISLLEALSYLSYNENQWDVKYNNWKTQVINKKPNIISNNTKKNYVKYFYFTILIVLLGFWTIWMMSISSPDYINNWNTDSIWIKNNSQEIEWTNAVLRIENIISNIWDYEVSIWTINEDFADENSEPPYEVIVNAWPNQIDSCFTAKQTLFEIAEWLYTDSILNWKISRVKFTAWGKLKASLWSNDTWFNWSNNWPSNFWKVLQEYKSYEDNSINIYDRTYWVKIDKKCD